MTITARKTPCVVVPAAFPIGGSYHCLTRPLHGSPNTLFRVYRTIDGREIGTLISWPSVSDAQRMEAHYEAWLKATKGTGRPLHLWQPPDNRKRRGFQC